MTCRSLHDFSKALHLACLLHHLESRRESARKAASLMLILTLAVTFFSVFNVSNAAVNQFDEWVPWTPLPDTVHLNHRLLGSIHYVDVSFYTMEACYNVSSWGVPTFSGRNITGNAEVWHWNGFCILIIGPFFYNHTYVLGNLPAGDYSFDFRVWGHLVKEITFSVVQTLPRLEVDPYYSYVRDGFATINITIQGIEASDHLVGIQLLLNYDGTVLQLFNVIEGPFMQDPRWNLHGTFFLVEPSELYDFYFQMGEVLLPDENGVWTVFPEGGGVVTTLRFHASSNKTYDGHIWTWVSLSSISAMSSESKNVGISSSGGWVCLLEEAAADVVMDGRVDMWDLATVAKRFGSSLGDSRWRFRADVNGDNRIDMNDLGFVANQWGNSFELPALVPGVPGEPWPPIELP